METIRFCKIEELEKLQQFLHTYWREDHILSKHKELLEFQHLNVIENRNVSGSYQQNQVNYVVAVTPSDEFTAVLGFIPTFQYDSDMVEFKGGYPLNAYTVDIWLAIWCRATHATKGVGMKLYDHLVHSYMPRSIAAIGINDEIKKRYQSMGFATGKLNQYYFFKQNLAIAQPASAQKPEVYLKKSPLNEFNQHQFVSEDRPLTIPFKSDKYFINRYKCHIMYEYLFYGIYESASNILMDVLVIRKNKVRTDKINSNCLRIVDAYNHFKNIPNITAGLNQILTDHDAEYIDSLNYGIPEAKFEEIGFKKRIGNEIIIPNYFEPFVQENVDIEFAYKIFKTEKHSPFEGGKGDVKLPAYADEAPYIIFKGDSDQDRPNLIH